jgi:hypothetical protein
MKRGRLEHTGGSFQLTRFSCSTSRSGSLLCYTSWDNYTLKALNFLHDDDDDDLEEEEEEEAAEEAAAEEAAAEEDDGRYIAAASGRLPAIKSLVLTFSFCSFSPDDDDDE